jgi:hypothetical protein
MSISVRSLRYELDAKSSYVVLKASFENVFAPVVSATPDAVGAAHTFPFHENGGGFSVE